MEPQTQKKEWKTPELIVLIRSNPEEAVLGGCKADVGGSSGPPSVNKCKNGSIPCNAQRLS